MKVEIIDLKAFYQTYQNSLNAVCTIYLDTLKMTIQISNFAHRILY